MPTFLTFGLQDRGTMHWHCLSPQVVLCCHNTFKTQALCTVYLFLLIPFGSEDLPGRTVRGQGVSQLGGWCGGYPRYVLPTPALPIWTVRLPSTVLSDTWHPELTTHWRPLRLKTAATAAQAHHDIHSAFLSHLWVRKIQAVRQGKRTRILDIEC